MLNGNDNPAVLLLGHTARSGVLKVTLAHDPDCDLLLRVDIDRFKDCLTLAIDVCE